MAKSRISAMIEATIGTEKREEAEDFLELLQAVTHDPVVKPKKGKRYPEREYPIFRLFVMRGERRMKCSECIYSVPAGYGIEDMESAKAQLRTHFDSRHRMYEDRIDITRG